MTNPEADPRRGRAVLEALAIILIAIPVYFIDCGARPVVSILEERVGITSREMWRKEEWIVPTMNGELRLQKPPFAYWIVHLCAMARGQFDDTTLRLPFAFVALGTALLTWRLGRTLGGPAVGLVAAVCLMTSAVFIKESHLATSDPALAFTAAGAWCFYASARKRDEAGQTSDAARLAMYFFLGLGGLAKGPVILLLCVAPFLIEAAFTRSLVPLRPFRSLPGLVIFLVLGFAWPIAVIARLSATMSPWEAIRLWYLESFGKVLPSAGIEDGYRFQRHSDNEWYFYFPRLFSAFTVWSPVLIAALVVEARKRGLARLPWLLFLVIFMAFTLVAEKKTAYMLPLAPAGALLVATLLVERYGSYHAVAARVSKWLVLPAFLLLVLVSMGVARPQLCERLGGILQPEFVQYFEQSFEHKSFAMIVLGASPLIGFFALTRLFRGSSPVPPYLAIGAVLAAITVAQAHTKLVMTSSEGDMREYALQAGQIFKTGETIYVLGSKSIGAAGSGPGGLVYYVDRPAKLIDDALPANLSTVPSGALLLASEKRVCRHDAQLPLGTDPPLRRWTVGERPRGHLGGFVVKGCVNPDTENPKDRTYILERE